MLNNKNTISCNFTSQNVLFIIHIYTIIVLLLKRVIFISHKRYRNQVCPSVTLSIDLFFGWYVWIPQQEEPYWFWILYVSKWGPYLIWPSIDLLVIE